MTPVRPQLLPRALWWLLGPSLVGVSLLGCGPTYPPRPRAAHPVEVRSADVPAASLLPAELDVVVRIDLARMRLALGEALDAQLLGQAYPTEELTTDPWVSRLFRQAEVAWIAFRPGRQRLVDDSAVLLEGQFEGLDPRQRDPERWLAPVRLAGGWRRWDRAGKAERSAPARIYEFVDERVVLVSEAAIDSAARSIEQRSSQGLSPPARGDLSFALRSGSWIEELTQRRLADNRWLATLRKATGYAELASGVAVVEVDLEFEDASSATRGGRALELLTLALAEGEGVVAQVARESKVEVVESHAVVRWSRAANGFASRGEDDS